MTNLVSILLLNSKFPGKSLCFNLVEGDIITLKYFRASTTLKIKKSPQGTTRWAPLRKSFR